VEKVQIHVSDVSEVMSATVKLNWSQA